MKSCDVKRRKRMNILQNNLKKVSVVVPNYNYARYMRGRLRSILKQTYPIYELIILDDCSDDGSVEVIEEEVRRIRTKNPELKVSFVKNRVNSGKAMAQWEKGVRLATGDYVWIAEADDRSRRRFLEKVMRGFDDSRVVISYSESMIINGRGMMMVPSFRWSRDKEKTGHYRISYVSDGVEEIKKIMAIRCTIPNVSAAVFLKSNEVVKYIDEALKYTQVGDWYLYLRMLEKGKIAYNRESLNKFRVHSDSTTGKNRRNEEHLREVKMIHGMVKRKYKLEQRVLIAMTNEEKRIKERLGWSERYRV